MYQGALQAGKYGNSTGNFFYIFYRGLKNNKKQYERMVCMCMHACMHIQQQKKYSSHLITQFYEKNNKKV